MQVKWATRARKNLEQIVVHVREHFSDNFARQMRNELFSDIAKLGEFPQLGKVFSNNSNRRFIVIQGNAVYYEIIIEKNPYIIIVCIKPRRKRTAE